MARALENPEAVPTYLDFFAMTRAPFARLSEPIQVFHAEQYSLLYGHLVDATEHSDRLLVLTGAEGSGKTTLLNRYIASLGHENSFATFDETCVDARHFCLGLLRQLGFSDISGSLNELRHICREFLIHRGRAADPVLVIVDNAHLVSPSILEQLRWLSEIQIESVSVISLVLSGNSDLARIMASPAMSLLSFGSQISFSIRVFSEQETDEYVRHRLRIAGASESAKLTTDARPLIHRFSGGNPRLINKLCNAVLTQALEQKTRVISEPLIRRVAEEQKFVPHVVPLHGQSRRKSDSDDDPAARELLNEERISPREAPAQQAVAGIAADLGQTDMSLESLLAQVSRLSDELDASRTSTQKALQDVDARDGDINAMLDKVAQQTRDLEQAAATARDSAAEIEQLRLDKVAQQTKILEQAAATANKGTAEIERLRLEKAAQQTKFLEQAAATEKESTAEIEQLREALRQSQQHSDQLRDELKIEKRAAKSTGTELARTLRRLEKIEDRKAVLQESVRELKADQKKGAAEVRRNSKVQDKKIAELEKSISKRQEEGDSLRTRAEEADRLEEVLASKEAHIGELQGEIEAYVDELTATQLQLSDNLAVTKTSDTAPSAHAYTGEIGTLEILKDGVLDQVLTLEPSQKRLMIGRGDDSELCLKSKFVSRHHALVFLAGPRAYIEDLRSYNGTIVNGKKISRHDLHPDDTIAIGDFELRPRRA